MAELIQVLPEVTPAPPVRRGQPLIAWIVILGSVAFILWRYDSSSPQLREQYDLLTMRMQARYLVGLARMGKFLSTGASNPEVMYPAAQNLNHGTYAQRLRFVVLAGELQGAEEARTQLHHLNERYHEVCGEPPAEEAKIAKLLDRLYSLREKKNAAARASLSPQEQQQLREQLGWFGDLALAPADEGDTADRQAALASAFRTCASMLIGGLTMLALAAAALIPLVTLLVLWLVRGARVGLTTGSRQAGIYAEAFALYMLLFLGLGFAGRYVTDWLQLRHGTLALSGVAALCSLAAVGWPVLRGIPWRQVRSDIGWTFGRRPWLEPFLGLGGYLMALPLLLIALVAILMLTQLRDLIGLGPEEFGPSNNPAHPIIIWVSRSGWWIWLEVLFVASIVAPIVEETMFRGILYRHLRESTSHYRPVLSVLLSAVLVSFLFAIIHPQGVLGVPSLMALALAFSFLREWRGTLIPPMIAHGINNAVATVLLFVMVS
jgi:membrane protease YdiL (CAAX protease family)